VKSADNAEEDFKRTTQSVQVIPKLGLVKHIRRRYFVFVRL